MEEIIKFETAKLAEEKGYKFNYNESTLVNIPSQSSLQRWLREQHDIHIIILYSGQKVDDFDYDYEILYFEGNDKIKFNNAKRIITKTMEGFDKYEQALEKALEKALNLI